MDSEDKSLVIGLIAALAFVVGSLAANQYHERVMQQISAERHAKEWQLKLELEQAKADQARYRALEVGYLCEFIDGSGERYVREGC